MMKPLALVTGGTRGIGLGISLALAREGYDLALCGMRPPQDVEPRLDSLREAGADVFYLPADVSDREDRRRLLQEVERRFGRLNVLVNNAGIAPRKRLDLLEAGEESFEEVLRINLQGPYFLTQAAAGWMIRQRQADEGFRGCILFISSISASVASVNRGEYCVSKAGVAMTAKLFAVRLAEYDIPVYEIRPGIIRTDMTSVVRQKYDELISGGLLLQPRWGTPEDIGRAAASLVRGDFPYSTGEVFVLDGGLTLPRL